LKPLGQICGHSQIEEKRKVQNGSRPNAAALPLWVSDSSYGLAILADVTLLTFAIFPLKLGLKQTHLLCPVDIHAGSESCAFELKRSPDQGLS
jgi:hypothetical protein